ncbi:hypothetical protein [Erythrobacter aurantius]|uniref:hypothetical protein n=1 Tax=Erythrobacter aurantius TaxID=2909249 RepID=UPI00207960FC|nr:hypothetical protein [Erythrobacter aurantius]
MTACLAVLAASGVAAQAVGSDPEVIEGRRSYSEDLAPLLEQGHVFVECDRLEIRRGGSEAEIAFTYPSRLRSVEFRGGFTRADRFEISAIRLRSQNEWTEAEGQCEFGPLGRERTKVTCLVKDGPRFFLVNFIHDS